MSKVSVIIPSLNEEMYLNKTILNVLENATGDIEIIPVLDGWEPEQRISDYRVKYLKHDKPHGQRPSINEAARMATGNFIMKLDAHCAVGKGFDEILARDCKYTDTMIPAMFNLDVETWSPKSFDDWDKAVSRGKLNIHMYVGWKDGRLRTQYYSSKERKRLWERDKGKDIVETMSCMGPAFFMHKDRFWELGGCDEGHGHWGQQGIEVACKAWLSGGRLVSNKNTWFAHFFRGGGVPEGHKSGFPYSISQRQVDRARSYSEDLWLKNKWEKQQRTMEWFVKKFNPPSWEGKINTDDSILGVSKERMKMFIPMYKHIHKRKHDALWKGVPFWKFPTDIALYHEAIWETKPDTIVEIGTANGGSAIYFQDMLDLCNPGGKVITVDIRDRLSMPKDPRIFYVIGDSTKKESAEIVKSLVRGKVMVTIDGNHDRIPVKWDLHNYSPFVTSGQYLVVEDCFTHKGLFGPGEALEWFLNNHSDFVQTHNCRRYMIGMTMGGWLKRK